MLEQFPEARQHAIKRAVGGGISHWLTTLPLDRYHFDLAPIEFRDALALRYLRTPPGLPSRCDGCGESFSLQHGLDCPKGGLVIRRHNEIRDCLGDMAALVWSQVIKEPVVREGDPASNDPVCELTWAYVVCGSPRWRRCWIFELLILTPHLIGDAHPPLCLTVGPLRRKGCIALLLRTGEEILHLLSSLLMAYCNVKHLILLNIFLLVWLPDGKDLSLRSLRMFDLDFYLLQ